MALTFDTDPEICADHGQDSIFHRLCYTSCQQGWIIIFILINEAFDRVNHRLTQEKGLPATDSIKLCKAPLPFVHVVISVIHATTGSHYV